ncbi:MAG: hypothetical protein LAO76_16030 [Acidobacteriia bacterium]|nr:hypothetical protein [Terriglobia bacterium]
MRLARLVPSIVICALLFGPTIASAAAAGQNESVYVSDIENRLDRVTATLALGYAIIPDADNARKVGILWGGSTSAEIPYRLQAGRAYLFIGVCDKDCSDLDFTLFNQNRSVVAIEMVSNSHGVPIFAFAPQQTGTYYLRATMQQCRTRGCYWGVDIFRKAE